MTGHDDVPTTPRATRRAVVRTGVRAAWAVPVITVVAAVPAYAASGGSLAVTLAMPTRTPSPTNVGNLNTLLLTSTVTNSGTTTTAFTIVVLVSPSTDGDNFTGSTASDVSGFASPVRSSAGAGWRDVVFTYVATSQLAPGAPLAFQPTVSLSLARPGTVTITALPGGDGTSGTASATFT